MAEFNPRKVEKTLISVRIPLDTLKDVDRISANNELSRNEFIVQCIGFAIENYSKEEIEKK